MVPALAPVTMMNNGQTCVNQTRVLAPRESYDEVVELMTEAVGGFRVGDPLDPSTQVGPVLNRRQRDRVEGYIASGREQGARVTTGGGRPSSFERGYYVEPTVFADVDNSMRIAREEIFGPVVAVIPYESDEQAVDIANDTTYGLGGSVWSSDPEHAKQVAYQLRTGTVGINGYGVDQGSPFGGFKESGIGRELGPEGLASYTELQSVALLHEAGS
jgi:aldehyde dehydrogenase (NAD+)